MKIIYKYGTGQEVPESAIYLHTVVEEKTERASPLSLIITRFVWHYFLVEVSNKNVESPLQKVRATEKIEN